MNDNCKEIFRFGDYRLEIGTRMLWVNDEFVSISPKSFELLYLLVSNSPNVVSRQEIMDKVWPEVIVEDGNINFTVSYLRNTVGLKDLIKTVPKHGYRFDGEVFQECLTQNPEVVSAQLKDTKRLTGNTEHHEVIPDRSGSMSVTTLEPTRVFRHNHITATGIFALICVLLFGGFFLLRAWTSNVSTDESSSNAIESIQTIAVFPFKTLGEGSDKLDDELAMLLSSELAERLGWIKGIKVRPFETVKDLSADTDPLLTGKEIGVDAIIKGRLTVLGKGVEIEIELLKTDDGKRLWTEKVFFEDMDSTALYGDVSFRVASRLMRQLSYNEQTVLGKLYTDSPEAYKLYRKARARFLRSTPGDFDEMLNWYNQAVTLDPSFALAYAGLSDLFFRRGNSLEGDDSITSYKRAEVFALRAFELDPQLSETHTSLGRVQRRLNQNYEQAANHFEKAIELNPNNVNAHGYLGQIKILTGDPNEALQIVKRIEEIDPTAGAIIFLSFRANEALKNYESGLKKAEELYSLDKQPPYSRMFYANFLLYNGQYEKASLIAEEGLSANKGFAFVWHRIIASAALKQGDYITLKSNEDILAKGSSSSTKYLYWLAVLKAEQGLYDEALSALEKCHDSHEPWLMWLKSEPSFEPIKNDPRFERLLKRLNLS